MGSLSTKMISKYDIDLCIVDFDETLVRSEKIKKKAFKKILGEKYFQMLKQLILKGNPREVIFRKYIKLLDKEITQEAYSSDLLQLMDQFKSCTEKNIINSGIDKGVVEFLNETKSIFPLIINSVTPVNSLQNILRLLKIDHIFSAIVGGKLPKVEAMKQVLNFNSKNYKNILIIGDSEHDHMLANNLNGYFLLVPPNINLGNFYRVLKNKDVWNVCK